MAKPRGSYHILPVFPAKLGWGEDKEIVMCVFCKTISLLYRSFTTKKEEFDEPVNHLACPTCFGKLLKGELGVQNV